MAGPASPPQVDSHDVVRWAESADGTRAEILYLLQEGDQFVVKRESEIDAGDRARCLMTFLTRKQQPRRPQPHVTVVHASGTTPLDRYDAVFWTESSVEKFLWPYYHAHRIYDTDLAAFRKAFDDDPNVIAIMHTPLTHTEMISDELNLAVRKDDGTVELVSLGEYQRMAKPR